MKPPRIKIGHAYKVFTGTVVNVVGPHPDDGAAAVICWHDEEEDEEVFGTCEFYDLKEEVPERRGAALIDPNDPYRTPQQRLDAALDKFMKAKDRYHTEQSYRELKAAYDFERDPETTYNTPWPGVPPK